MHVRSKRLFRSLVIGIALTLPVGLVVSAQQRPAMPKPKNLKVLKNLPEGELIPTMRSWNAALGVKCDFCHAIKPDHTGFDLDTKKEKGVARAMFTMTTDINKHKVVDNKVGCFTCHHGHPVPEPMHSMGPGMRPPGR
jgi:hypothetical protein